jgi:cytochrome c oxidase subunit 2
MYMIDFKRITTLALVAALGAGQAAAQDIKRGKQLYAICVSCHGPKGHGNAETGAPQIAELPAWYVKSQLKKFQDGKRGAHPKDKHGLLMRPMSRTLKTDQDIADVAEYIAKEMKAVKPATTLEGGDAKRGQTLYTTAGCIGCHQANGKGLEAVKAPPLTESSDWYMLSQLKKVKSGVRGAGDPDLAGMMPVLAMVPDEQAMKDLIAYIQTLSEK